MSRPGTVPIIRSTQSAQQQTGNSYNESSPGPALPTHLEFRYRNGAPVLDRNRVPVICVPSFAGARLKFDGQMKVLLVKEALLPNTHSADVQIPKRLPLVHCVELPTVHRARIELLAQATLETGLAVNGLMETVDVICPKKPEPPDGAGLIFRMLDVDADVGLRHWRVPLDLVDRNRRRLGPAVVCLPRSSVPGA